MILCKVPQINKAFLWKVLWCYNCFSCSSENRNNDKFYVKLFSCSSQSSCWVGHPYKNPKEYHWDHLDLAPNMKLFLFLMLLVNAENQIKTDSFQDNMSGIICSSFVHKLILWLFNHFSVTFLNFFFQAFLFVRTMLDLQISNIFYREPTGNFCYNQIFKTNFVHAVFTNFFNFLMELYCFWGTFFSFFLYLTSFFIYHVLCICFVPRTYIPFFSKYQTILFATYSSESYAHFPVFKRSFINLLKSFFVGFETFLTSGEPQLSDKPQQTNLLLFFPK